MTTMRAMIRMLLCACALEAPVAAQISFQEVANDVGLVHTTRAGAAPAGIPSQPDMQRALGAGCAVGDYDGDGDLDVYLLQGHEHPNRLFRNDLDRGTPGFTDVTESAGIGLGDLGSGRVAHFADLDDDGDLDLLLLNDQDQAASMPRSKIFENRDDGTFVDVGPSSGFVPGGFALCGCALADFDRDGLLDVFVSAWTHHVGFPSPAHSWFGQNRLYKNLGGMQFADVTAAAGLDPQFERFDCFTPIFHDLTGDDQPDLLIAVDHADELLYRNEGGTFTLDATTGLDHTGNDMGIACGDIDRDGRLDFFMTNITDPWCGRFGTLQHNVLWMRSPTSPGGMSFVDEALVRGVDNAYWGWGTAFADLDHDDDLDLVACNGFDDFVTRVDPNCGLVDTPYVLFQNDGTGQFESVQAAGFTDLGDDSRALVPFDYDRDGDLDLLVTNMNEPVRLFRNDTPRRRGQSNWLVVQLRQRHGNRHGLGATIDVRTDDGVLRRQPMLSAESYLSGFPAERHFGLGPHAFVDSVRVRWTDGTATTLRNVPAGQILVVEQPEFLSNWDHNGQINELDAWLFAWAWVLEFPSADLNGNDLMDMGDVDLFLADWWAHRGIIR